jgi:hypothetical protein
MSYIIGTSLCGTIVSLKKATLAAPNDINVYSQRAGFSPWKKALLHEPDFAQVPIGISSITVLAISHCAKLF